MTRCSCGADNPEDAKFCSNCGLEQTTATQCVCGAEHSPDAKFCNACGLNLGQREPQRQDDSIHDRPAKRGTIRWDNWVLWFLVGIVIIVLLLALAVATAPPPDETPTPDGHINNPSTPLQMEAPLCERPAESDYIAALRSYKSELVLPP